MFWNFDFSITCLRFCYVQPRAFCAWKIQECPAKSTRNPAFGLIHIHNLIRKFLQERKRWVKGSRTNMETRGHLQGASFISRDRSEFLSFSARFPPFCRKVQLPGIKWSQVTGAGGAQWRPKDVSHCLNKMLRTVLFGVSDFSCEPNSDFSCDQNSGLLHKKWFHWCEHCQVSEPDQNTQYLDIAIVHKRSELAVVVWMGILWK